MAAVHTLNRKFNSGTATLAQKRKVARSLSAAAHNLIAHVTDDTSTDARTYDAGIVTLLRYTVHASSMQQLLSEEKHDVELRSALADASASLQNLVSWHAANCQ